MTKTKLCRGCGEDKAVDNFYQRSSRCKICTCRKVREHRQNSPHVQAYDRARGPRVKPGYIAEWRARNPEKYRAQTAVGNAVRDGRLKKGPCAVCGETKGVHAHHHDYSKKLDVIWMCPLHHRRHHGPDTTIWF